mgnify:CR=1 FL=1
MHKLFEKQNSGIKGVVFMEKTKNTTVPGPQNLMLENREKLDELARYLYEKETITGEEFMEILNR